jgi:hypothetical protein
MAKVKDKAQAQTEELINPWSKLVKIPVDASSFKSPTSGKTYYVNRVVDDLSLKRYEMLEKMLTEMQFSMTNEEFMEHLQEQAKAINSDNKIMTSVINYNLMTGLADLNTKHIITWWISTLYIAREDEDVTTWSETTAKEKIADWMSFTDSSFFLQLRDTMFDRLIKLCEHISHVFSDYPLNQGFTQNRIKKLKAKYPVNQNNEP